MHIESDPLPFYTHDATGPESSALQLPPVREPGEEGYPECSDEEIDPDGWGDPEITEEMPYTDRAEGLKATIALYGDLRARIAYVSARLAYDRLNDDDCLNDDDIADMAKEEASLKIEIEGLADDIERTIASLMAGEE